MTRSTGIGVAKFPAASLAAACLLTMVAACGRGNADGSPSYTVGYVHGCDSGFTDLDMRVNFVKDENRFRLDADYRKGWREGHAECYAEGLRTLQQGGG